MAPSWQCGGGPAVPVVSHAQSAGRGDGGATLAGMSNDQPAGTPQNPQGQGGYTQPGTYPSSQAPTPQRGYPPSAYPQQPYGQQSGPAQGYPPSPYPQQPYGQQQAPRPAPPGTSDPYQITHFAAQYNSPSPYAVPQYAQPLPQLKPRSAVPGIVALVLVVIAMIMALATGLPASDVMREYFAFAMTAPGQAAIEEYIQSLMTSGAANSIGVAMMGMMGASLFGLAGVITGIVAAARNSGRLWGIIAIVAGLLSPFVVSALVFV